MMKPYEQRERVVEFMPQGAFEALENGDYRVQFLCHGMTADAARYYPQSTLEQAATAGVFDSAKMYLNHRDPLADKQRGHRDLGEWVATIKPGTVSCVDGTLQAIAHAHHPTALMILNDEVAKAAVGISHDSFVRTKEGRIDGKKCRIVEAIESCNSVDFVPAGNANGRVLETAPEDTEATEMDWNTVTLDELREARPDLIEQLSETAKPEPPAPQAPDAAIMEQLQEAKTEIAKLREARIKDSVMEIVRERVAEDANLSDASKRRVIERFKGEIIAPEEIAARVEEACRIELEYALELLREAGVKTRTVGAGGGAGEQAATPEQARESYEKQYKDWATRHNCEYIAPYDMTEKEAK